MEPFLTNKGETRDSPTKNLEEDLVYLVQDILTNLRDNADPIIQQKRQFEGSQTTFL